MAREKLRGGSACFPWKGHVFSEVWAVVSATLSSIGLYLLLAVHTWGGDLTSLGISGLTGHKEMKPRLLQSKAAKSHECKHGLRTMPGLGLVLRERTQRPSPQVVRGHCRIPRSLEPTLPSRAPRSLSCCRGQLSGLTSPRWESTPARSHSPAFARPPGHPFHSSPRRLSSVASRGWELQHGSTAWRDSHSLVCSPEGAKAARGAGREKRENKTVRTHVHRGPSGLLPSALHDKSQLPLLSVPRAPT